MSINDDVLRELFNNKDFRIALSLGFDRDAINEVVFNGLFKPSQAAPPDSSVYNGADPAFKQYIEHDVDRANEILDSLGLTWNDDQTQRFLPDGRPFELGVQVDSGGVFPHVPVAELMIQGWQDIGLKATLVPIGGELFGQRRLAGDYELQISSSNFGGAAPIIAALRCEPVPVCPNWEVNPPWAQWVMSGGAEGDEPPQDVKRLYQIFEEFIAEPDPQKRFELETEMYAIHNNNLWTFAAVKAPADLPTTWYAYFSNRMYNIPNPVAGEFYYASPETWAKRSN
jgi:peptide/nickel transport system substrate-binding protein